MNILSQILGESFSSCMSWIHLTTCLHQQATGAEAGTHSLGQPRSEHSFDVCEQSHPPQVRGAVLVSLTSGPMFLHLLFHFSYLTCWLCEVAGTEPCESIHDVMNSYCTGQVAGKPESWSSGLIKLEHGQLRSQGWDSEFLGWHNQMSSEGAPISSHDVLSPPATGRVLSIALSLTPTPAGVFYVPSYPCRLSVKPETDRELIQTNFWDEEGANIFGVDWKSLRNFRFTPY